MTRDEMIEKAARAWDDELERWTILKKGHWWVVEPVVPLFMESCEALKDASYYQFSSEEMAKAFSRELVLKAVLAAICPGLLAGTHWEAPMEATEQMKVSGEVICDTYCRYGGQMNNIFAAMRGAYLAESPK